MTDNATNNITFAKLIEEWGKTRAISFNATENHLRCFAHIINLSIQNVLIKKNLKQVSFCNTYIAFYIY